MKSKDEDLELKIWRFFERLGSRLSMIFILLVLLGLSLLLTEVLNMPFFSYWPGQGWAFGS